MRYCVIVVGLLFLSGCADKEMQKLGNVSYVYSGVGCDDAKKHWLLDITAANVRDSIFLDSKNAERKIEINSRALDSTSYLYSLLSKMCSSDSIYLELPASVFYNSLNGDVPIYLSDSENISVNLWMRDKLTDLGYIAFKQTFEAQAMSRYVDQNRWNATLDTSTQIYYEVLKKKKGVKQNFTKVKVKYLLKTMNEQLIAYSKDEDPFIYDVNDKGVIGGIRFLTQYLKVGESARAVVPSSQAFGLDGNRRVSGYSPVILEIEVLEGIQ